MADDEVVPVYVPNGNCHCDGIHCVASGFPNYCNELRRKHNGCVDVIFLTPEQAEKHTSKIITW